MTPEPRNEAAKRLTMAQVTRFLQDREMVAVTRQAWDFATGLAAERAAPKVDVEEVLGILAGLDGAFQWITEHYRAAMVAMPTEHYRAIGRAEHFAARLAGEEEAEHE